MTYEETLLRLAQADESVVVMTAENRAAIRGLPARLGGRFIDVGIAEQTMIGVAAGLSLRGRTPVCHSLAAFLTLRAFEFIRTDVGIAGLPVKLVGGVPGFLSEANGPTHQAIEDVAILRGIPGMRVFCPADRAELVEALPAVLAEKGPVYVRFNGREPAVERHQPFAFGRAEVLAEGDDVCILTYGTLVREAVGARAALAARGLSAGLVNVRSLWPLDEAAVLRAATARLVVTVEDHFEDGGLATLVAEVLMRARRTARVLPLALPRRWFVPALLDDVLLHEGFTPDRIAQRILAAVES